MNVNFIWVPAQIGVEGNELADRYTKEEKGNKHGNRI